MRAAGFDASGRFEASTSGRVALLAGASAAFIAGTFAILHRLVLSDWPAVALDGPMPMLAYLAAGLAFQFAVPIFCLSAFVFGRPARHLWTARVGLSCAALALLGYALYVRTCLSMTSQL
jgi:hypothetical protein